MISRLRARLGVTSERTKARVRPRDVDALAVPHVVSSSQNRGTQKGWSSFPCVPLKPKIPLLKGTLFSLKGKCKWKAAAVWVGVGRCTASSSGPLNPEGCRLGLAVLGRLVFFWGEGLFWVEREAGATSTSICCNECGVSMAREKTGVISWFLLGNMLHFCVFWFSGKSPLNCFFFAPLPTSTKISKNNGVMDPFFKGHGESR